VISSERASDEEERERRRSRSKFDSRRLSVLAPHVLRRTGHRQKCVSLVGVARYPALSTASSRFTRCTPCRFRHRSRDLPPAARHPPRPAPPRPPRCVAFPRNARNDTARTVRAALIPLCAFGPGRQLPDRKYVIASAFPQHSDLSWISGLRTSGGRGRGGIQPQISAACKAVGL